MDRIQQENLPGSKGGEDKPDLDSPAESSLLDLLRTLGADIFDLPAGPMRRAKDEPSLPDAKPIDLIGPPFHMDIVARAQVPLPQINWSICQTCHTDLSFDDQLGYSYGVTRQGQADGQSDMRGVCLEEPSWVSAQTLCFYPPGQTILQYHIAGQATGPEMRELALSFWHYLIGPAAYRPETYIERVYVKPCPRCDARDAFLLRVGLGEAYTYLCGKPPVLPALSLNVVARGMLLSCADYLLP